MARSTAPRGKIVRRFGVNIFENPKYDRLLERNPNPPGQQGAKPGRRKISAYGQQLIEKQKLKNAYGLLEKQFRRTFDRAQRQKGVTGENLMALLETRLDNAIFRAGFGVSRSQTRQLVNHGHFTVNERRVDIPSYQVQPGDLIRVREIHKSQALLTHCIAEIQSPPRPSWLEIAQETLSFTVRHRPQREEIPSLANEQLVVELYSK